MPDGNTPATFRCRKSSHALTASTTGAYVAGTQTESGLFHRVFLRCNTGPAHPLHSERVVNNNEAKTKATIKPVWIERPGSEQTATEQRVDCWYPAVRVKVREHPIVPRYGIGRQQRDLPVPKAAVPAAAGSTPETAWPERGEFLTEPHVGMVVDFENIPCRK